MNSPPGRRSLRSIWIVLLFIFLTGSFYRFWGLSSVYHRVDDIPLARHIERMYHGRWEPNPVYYYPAFFNYIVAAGLRVGSAILSVRSGPDVERLYPFRFDQILLVARLLSAFLGSLTILLVYAIGKRLYGVSEGLLAAFFLSVAVIPIIYSHQIVLDVPMAFFFALAFFFCAALLEKRRWRDYLLAGFACGLAVATKYNGIFILAALFLGHLLGAPKPARRQIFRLFADPKIYAAGLMAVAGFFLAHPYALLHFRRFIGASKVLLRVVHEPEAYLVPIQPLTLLEHIHYSKYVMAVKNILIAEGPIYLALIVLGVIFVIVRRNRTNGFLALSGLAYFKGALGFLGFSRFRDLAALAIFYSFLAMLGVIHVSRWLWKRRAAKAACVILLIVFIVALEFSALTNAYVLWEDDTTEVAERWIRRNIPEGSSFGKEWFSPSLHGGEYRVFSKPFLVTSGFPPFSHFDFIITSSAASAHFSRNAKFYPEVIQVYKGLREENERVKDFYFRAIEYKNPELRLYTTWSRARIKQRISLPSALPLENPEREFEIADGSPYGKNVLNFVITGGEKIERLIISRRKITEMAAFVIGGKGQGEITITNSWWRKRVRFREGEPSHVFFQPRLSFPFYGNLYRITVRGSGAIGSAVVKLCVDPFDIAMEFFGRQDFRQAQEFFLKALNLRRPGPPELEIHLYLAYCARELGNKKDVRHHIDLAASHPLWRRYRGLFQPAEDDDAWVRRFEKFSGLSSRLLEETLTHHIENTASPEMRLPAQPHRLVLRFSDPERSGGPVGELEVIARSPQAEERTSRQIVLEPTAEPGFSTASLSYSGPGLETTVQLIVRLSPEKMVILDSLLVYPDIKEFVREKGMLFAPLIESLPPINADD